MNWYRSTQGLEVFRLGHQDSYVQGSTGLTREYAFVYLYQFCDVRALKRSRDGLLHRYRSKTTATAYYNAAKRRRAKESTNLKGR
jgi:hypothetical protein